MNRNKLYFILITACTCGYIWILFSYNYTPSAGFNVCLFKKLTGIPCPSCGSTRALILLLHGNFAGSLFMNPFAVLLSFILLFSPFWILFDLLAKKSTLLNFYQETEHFLKQKYVAITAISLVLANWIWNIYKGL